MQAPVKHHVATAPAVDVWQVDLGAVSVDRAALLRTLSDDERNRAAAFHREIHRDRFINAHAALREILAACTGIRPSEVRLAYGPAGKPSLAEPGSLRFNMSHSEDMALVAVTAGAEVGVDVEWVGGIRDARGIVARYFQPRERKAIAQLDGAAMELAFMRGWTRKEAVAKAAGAGLAMLERIEVSVTGHEPARVVAIDGDAEEAGQWSLGEIAPAEGYVGAVALRASRLTLRPWSWPPGARSTPRREERPSPDAAETRAEAHP
jgi:4'-phosphopantetheinyl transferase